MYLYIQAISSALEHVINIESCMEFLVHHLYRPVFIIIVILLYFTLFFFIIFLLLLNITFNNIIFYVQRIISFLKSNTGLQYIRVYIYNSMVMNHHKIIYNYSK